MSNLLQWRRRREDAKTLVLCREDYRYCLTIFENIFHLLWFLRNSVHQVLLNPGIRNLLNVLAAFLSVGWCYTGHLQGSRGCHRRRRLVVRSGCRSCHPLSEHATSHGDARRRRYGQGWFQQRNLPFLRKTTCKGELFLLNVCAILNVEEGYECGNTLSSLYLLGCGLLESPCKYGLVTLNLPSTSNYCIWAWIHPTVLYRVSIAAKKQ